MLKKVGWWRILVVAATLTMTAAPARGAATVLFDQGHGERFLIDRDEPLDLSRLATLFRQQGNTVGTVETPLTEKMLAAADVLVMSGPFVSLSAAETDAVVGFVDRGGRLAVMLHVGAPVAGLLHRLDLDVSNGVLHERHDIIGDDINFHVNRFAPHPLFDGVRQFSLYGGWALMNTGVGPRIVAATSPEAWVDLDGDGRLSAGDAVASFGVCVAGERGAGRFVVFGDDAIFQNKFLDADNLLLARNLVMWLGDEQRVGKEDDLLKAMHGP